jgi:hypothetical protein
MPAGMVDFVLQSFGVGRVRDVGPDLDVEIEAIADAERSLCFRFVGIPIDEIELVDADLDRARQCAPV